MGKHRAPYPAEFRARIVDLVKAGRTPEELAREFEPSVQTIINWVAQADIDAGGYRQLRCPVARQLRWPFDGGNCRGQLAIVVAPFWSSVGN